MVRPFRPPKLDLGEQSLFLKAKMNMKTPQNKLMLRLRREK